MKKTLIVTLEFPPVVGGIATYIHNLALHLPEDNVVVLAPKHNNAGEWDKEQPYRIIRQNLFYPVFVWPRWLKMYFLIKKIVKQEKIESLVIHHALPVGYVGYLLRKVLPYVVFSHGTDFVYGIKTKWKKKMFAKVMGSAKQIIFNSESLKSRFLAVFGQFSSKSTVVYPCPDEFFSLPANSEIVEALRDKYALRGKKVLLTISRIAEGKGFPHLIETMPMILQKNPNLVWMIVGDGNKRAEMTTLIQKNYLQNIVRYVGEVPHNELPAFYAVADLFVLLTHPDEQGKEEGLGLVFLEAGAMGLPIVAGKSGGVDEAVLNGQTGIVLDVYKQKPEIATAILSLLADKAQRDELGQKAREFVKKTFNWEEQIGKLVKFLE